MCGRFASSRSTDDLADIFAVTDIPDDTRHLPPSRNLAPTDPVRIVVDRPDKETHEIRRSLRVARWGLIPSWSRDAKGAAMINARSETLTEKATFATPFAKRRCIVPADGYYEWRPALREATTRGAKIPKQPYYIHPPHGVAALAGLYEFWRDPTKASNDPERWLVTTTIITRSAAPELAEIHDRMPLVLADDTWDLWLDPTADPNEVRGLLGGGVTTLVAHTVSTAVNTVANNGPALIERVASTREDGVSHPR